MVCALCARAKETRPNNSRKPRWRNPAGLFVFARGGLASRLAAASPRHHNSKASARETVQRLFVCTELCVNGKSGRGFFAGSRASFRHIFGFSCVMSSDLGRWGIAFFSCAIFCALAITLLDEPILCFFAQHHLAWQMPIEFPIYLASLSLPLGAGAIPVYGLTRLRGRPVTPLARALMLAGFAVLSALATTQFLLKPFFGRSNIAAYFGAHRYDFSFGGGTWQSSFPSGHAVIITAFLSVFWILYPRWRALYVAAVAAVLIGLAAARWHFVSDIAAGAFIGCIAGPITLALWRHRPVLALSSRQPAAPGLWR